MGFTIENQLFDLPPKVRSTFLSRQCLLGRVWVMIAIFIACCFSLRFHLLHPISVFLICVYFVCAHAQAYALFSCVCVCGCAQYLPLQNKLLGKGAYGHVCAVTNSENGERLAVKKVKNAFDDVIDAKRVLREIRNTLLTPHLAYGCMAIELWCWISFFPKHVFWLLALVPTALLLRPLHLLLAGLLCSFDHENVLCIKDLQMPKDPNGKHEDVYIITELLDTDLSKVIYSPQPLIDDHCQYFLYQVFETLTRSNTISACHFAFSSSFGWLRVVNARCNCLGGVCIGRLCIFAGSAFPVITNVAKL